MDKTPTPKRMYVSTYAVKAANSKVMAYRTSPDPLCRVPAAERFVSRDEIRAAFKSAARKLRSV